MLGTEQESVEGEAVDDEKTPTLEFASEENQEVRAFLRERFLRALTGIVGNNSDLRMFNNTKVTAEFRGSDVNVTKFYVTQLKTPLGVLPKAFLRTSDVISLEVKDIGSAQQDKKKNSTTD